MATSMIPTPQLLASLEQKNGLPQGLLSAVMQQESAGNPNAVSPMGAKGAFQFMPETAAQYGIDPFNPEQAATAAAQMFGELSQKYQGDIPSMLAGYNWGQGNVDRKGLQNAPEETRNYIKKIQPQLGQQYADSGQIMNDASNIPPLPEGFTLEQPTATPSQGIPPLPEGFVLESEVQQPASQPVTQEPSLMETFDQSPFMGRMQADFAKRKQQANAIANADQSGIENLIQTAGLGVNLLGDAAGNVIGSGVRYINEAIPDNLVKRTLVNGATNLATDNPVLQAFGEGAGAVSEFAKEHPRLARNLQAVGSLGNVLPAVGATEKAVQGGLYAAEKAGSGAAKVAAAPVKGVALRAKGFNALAGDDLKALVREEGKKTTAAYKAVDKTGTVVSKDSTKSLQDKINSKLAETDLDAEFQPKTIAALRVLKNNIKDKATGSGQINLGKLDQFRRLLGRAVSPEDKLVAAQLRDVLDNHLDDLADTDLVGGTKDSINALNEARATASRGFAVEKIAKIIKKADGDDNAIRKGFTKFLEDDKNLRGFSGAEIEAFKQASKNTGAQAVEKFIGRFGIDGKGGVLPTLAASTTAGVGSLAVPAAIPAVVAGTAAKYTRKLAARGDAQKALETVLNRKVTKEELQKAFEARKGNK